jgi:hydrogenase maturation protein HypF
MERLETLDAFARAAEHLTRLFRINPQTLVCDRHPGYLSARWARDQAQARGLGLIDVQHHHAHIAAAMAENGQSGERPVIGVALDGTGYGDDGAIWGGEFLIADYKGYRRTAHLEYASLPGGDAAVRRPYRMALAHLHAAGLAWDEAYPCVAACPPTERRVLARQLESKLNCVPTSSMGRLFDAVASMIGVRHIATYEAQAAIELEAIAVTAQADAYPFDLTGDEPIRIDPAPMWRALAADLRAGMPAPRMAGRFHRGVAAAVIEVCRRIGRSQGLKTVGLSGGVFQNVTLLRLCVEGLRSAGFDVLTHRQVPPNDGGIALGQAAIAAVTIP